MISELVALFVAICQLESAKEVAPLHGHTNTAVWRHSLRQKKVDLRTFRRQEKCFKCVTIHERATNVCILYVLIIPKQYDELLYTYNMYL